MPVRMLKKLDHVRWVFFSSSLREDAGGGCEGFAMVVEEMMVSVRSGEERLEG